MADKSKKDAVVKFGKGVGKATKDFCLDVMRHHVQAVNREDGLTDLHGRVSDEAILRFNKQSFASAKQESAKNL